MSTLNVFFALIVLLGIPSTKGQFVQHMNVAETEDPIVASSSQAQTIIAKHFKSNMVLQRAPHRAQIYGFSNTIGEKILLKMSTPAGSSHFDVVHVSAGPGPLGGTWAFMLPPMEVNSTVKIQILSESTIITLANVIFGDVWVCSGQSNMKFPVRSMFNGSEEMEKADQYPNIRLMTVSLHDSHVPLYDFYSLDQEWTKPDEQTVGSFSAVCWLYGRHIHEATGVPVGLVASFWGGTSVRLWSSQDALDKCGVPPGFEEYLDGGVYDADEYSSVFGEPFTPKDRVMKMPKYNSALWNGMIYPMLPMTIYGAIWYQGEADTGVEGTMFKKYGCAFPAMIDDWRSKFNSASFGETSESFPFGFVQLAPNRNLSYVDVGFPDIRWLQTAAMGYTPNPKMPHVFMAVAMDLPDFSSPHGSIHPRYKSEVGQRLALSGLEVAYQRNESVFQGPFPNKVTQMSAGLEVDYGSKWTLDVRQMRGFEVFCPAKDGTNGTWIPTTIKSHTDTTVTLHHVSCGTNGELPTYLRYAWRESPCPLKQCAVYSTKNELPAPPFIMKIASELPV